jgi:hypothetical protein
MPWTFAHPAAVLPLRRLTGPGKLSLAGLMVGAVVPDLLYYVGQFGWASRAHSVAGLVTVCVPLGLLMLALLHLLRTPLADLLPQPHRRLALANAVAAGVPSLRTLILAAVSLMIGAATHVLWDAFTHDRQFFVEQIAWLRAPLWTVSGREFRVFNVLQHVSTVLGMACIAVVYVRHAGGWGAFGGLAAGERRRYWVLVGLMLIACLGAGALAWLGASEAVSRSALLVKAVIDATSLFALLLLGAAGFGALRQCYCPQSGV